MSPDRPICDYATGFAMILIKESIMTSDNFNRSRQRRIAATGNFYRVALGPRLGFPTIKATARGGWPGILTTLGVPAEVLHDRHGPCPGCGGTDRFRFDDRNGDGDFVCSGGGGDLLSGDGFRLLMHVHGWTTAEALRKVADTLGIANGGNFPLTQAEPSVSNATPQPTNLTEIRAKLNTIWAATVPVDAPVAEPARRYLARRGLSDLLQNPPRVWRFHPALDYWRIASGNPESLGRFPALVAKIESSDRVPVGLHQTYLTPDGRKADVPEPRKSRTLFKGALKGAAIPLYPASGRLAVGEGIETILSVRVALPDWPCWSCISATGLANVQIPASVQEILIAADADLTGLHAAEKLADRLTAEGRTVRILTPDDGDFNDAFRSIYRD